MILKHILGAFHDKCTAVFRFQANMEVDGKLRDSKLKTVSVGGLARLDGKIQQGFRGCMQVCLLFSTHMYQCS